MTPESIVKEVCGEYAVPGKKYHSPLPDELSRWYCYTSDGGHSLVGALKQDEDRVKEGSNFLGILLPISVKSVFRGYEIINSIIVVDLPYSSTLGLETPEEDYEF